MEKVLGKHNKWVVFYTLTIVALLFFALYLIGMVNIKLPEIKMVEPTPDRTLTMLQAICGLEKYERIALRSVKNVNKEYSMISESDISENLYKNSDYLTLAKNLCNTFDVSRKVEKKKISDTVWEYRYYTGILFDANRVTYVVYFNEDWRFVLLGNEFVRTF